MKNLLSKVLSICLIFGGGFLAACSNNSQAKTGENKEVYQAENKSKINSSINTADSKELENILTSHGCKVVNNSAKAEPMSITLDDFNKWQKENFNIRSKVSVLAKCKAKDNLFYKFLIEEETFQNEGDAEARFPRIKELPPNENGKSDLAVPILLREGFQFKNKVYTVGTFAYKVYLEGDVLRLKKKLETYILKSN